MKLPPYKITDAGDAKGRGRWLWVAGEKQMVAIRITQSGQLRVYKPVPVGPSCKPEPEASR